MKERIRVHPRNPRRLVTLSRPETAQFLDRVGVVERVGILEQHVDAALAVEPRVDLPAATREISDDVRVRITPQQTEHRLSLHRALFSGASDGNTCSSD